MPYWWDSSNVDLTMCLLSTRRALEGAAHHMGMESHISACRRALQVGTQRLPCTLFLTMVLGLPSRRYLTVLQRADRSVLTLALVYIDALFCVPFFHPTNTLQPLKPKNRARSALQTYCIHRPYSYTSRFVRSPAHLCRNASQPHHISNTPSPTSRPEGTPGTCISAVRIHLRQRLFI